MMRPAAEKEMRAYGSPRYEKERTADDKTSHRPKVYQSSLQGGMGMMRPTALKAPRVPTSPQGPNTTAK